MLVNLGERENGHLFTEVQPNNYAVGLKETSKNLQCNQCSGQG
jgi:hypothetical protein